MSQVKPLHETEAVYDINPETHTDRWLWDDARLKELFKEYFNRRFGDDGDYDISSTNVADLSELFGPLIPKEYLK